MLVSAPDVPDGESCGSTFTLGISTLTFGDGCWGGLVITVDDWVTTTIFCVEVPAGVGVLNFGVVVLLPPMTLTNVVWVGVEGGEVTIVDV